jgi:hypothetical protein
VPLRTLLLAFAIGAVYWPMGTAQTQPAAPAAEARLEQLWTPVDRSRPVDALYGPWGAASAPEPQAAYRYLKPKTSGVNPGMTVVDPAGRKWSVKQAPHDDRGDEGPIEVVVSRILSLAGYHQPPVHYLPAFTLVDTFGRRTEPGGRFRLDHPDFKEQHSWSWRQNPFIGTRPYQGLLVILMLLNSSDLRDTNNSIFEHRQDNGTLEPRYVVRDLGTSLGGTSRYQKHRGDLALFERLPFATGMRDGHVVFDSYAGWNQELFRGRIARADVEWACQRLDDIQLPEWRDAFQAGGYPEAIAVRYIARIRQKLGEARALVAPGRAIQSR